jgi:hypothetical protein
MQLRYLSALMTVAGERTSTIVFPLPIDILDSFGRNRPDGAARPAGELQPRTS